MFFGKIFDWLFEFSVDEYQGEDVSLGIWISQNPEFKEKVTMKTVSIVEHNGDCMAKNKLIIGHKIKPDKMKKCNEEVDEVDVTELL